MPDLVGVSTHGNRFIRTAPRRVLRLSTWRRRILRKLDNPSVVFRLLKGSADTGAVGMADTAMGRIRSEGWNCRG
jgi:hypothetical protein